MSAKRQRTMRDMFLSERQSDVVVNVMGPSQSDSSYPKQSDVDVAKLTWRDAWYGQFNWIEYNSELGKVFCKLCKEKGAKNVYGNVGSVNIKVSAFQDHQNSKEHKRLSWATQQGEKIMEKHIRAANKCCDEALLTLFRAAYFLGRETIPFNKYSSLCALLVASKASCTESMYHDEKSCAEMLFCISNVLQK